MLKCCILTLFLWNILHRFATVIKGTIDTETQFITTNTFIHSNTQIQIVFNFSPVEGYILLCSGKLRGSRGILTEPRSAPELAPVPDSEQWTLVSCGPGGSPDQCLSSLSTTLRQSMSQPCLYYHHKQKYTSIKCKKKRLFPRAERPRGIPTGGWWRGQHSTFSNIDFALHIATHTAAKHTNTLCKHCQPSWIVKQLKNTFAIIETIMGHKKLRMFGILV